MKYKNCCITEDLLTLKRYTDWKNTGRITEGEFQIGHPENVICFRTIGYDAFSNLSIKEVYLPEGIECIKEYAFKNCWNLVKISLPSTLKSIDYGVFDECYRLNIIIVNATTPPKLAENVFKEYNYSNLTIETPSTSLVDYQNSWGNQYPFLNIVSQGL